MSLHRARIEKTESAYVVIFPDAGITESGKTIDEALNKSRSRLSHIQISPDTPTGDIYIDLDTRVTSGGRKALDIPGDFHIRMNQDTSARLSEIYGVSVSTINRWKKIFKKS